ncbi:MAG: hypothetical protein U0R49_04665 [Fimbriimonadales bacterium]
MFTTVLAGMVFGFAPALDKWEIKAPYEKDKPAKMKVLIQLNADGQDLTVELVSMVKLTEKGDKLWKGEIGWDDIMMNGQPIGQAITAPCEIDARGKLLKTESEFGDDFRRQVMPLFFIYPEKSVGVGDKWSVESEKKPDGAAYKLKQDFEVVASEKVGDEETLKISAKFVEPGDGMITANGFFWINKLGQPLKVEMAVKNWPVPQQGSSIPEAKITGKFVK